MALKFAILGLLAESSQTGYELKARFGGSVGYFWEARFQQIYAELQRLQRDRLVSVETVPQRGKPTKKVYSLTSAGEAALHAWLDTPSASQPTREEFLVKVFSVARMDPRRALARLKEYREEHRRRLETYTLIERRLEESGAVSDDTTQDAMLGRYLALRRGIGYERECVRWCNWAVAQLRRRVKASS
jgi:DNA-binding PadR family transcriptional regulator